MSKLKSYLKGVLVSLFGVALFIPYVVQASLSPVLDTNGLYKVKNTNDAVYATSATAKPGEKLRFSIYVHNNVYNTTATNVRVQATLPGNAVTSYTSQATVMASNTGSKSGTTQVTLSELSTLSYVPGSTKLTDHYHNVSTLPDGVTNVGVGVNVGDVKGCYEYERWVTFEAVVKAVEKEPKKTALKVFKYNDLDGDATQDSNEAGLSGWEFRVTGPNGYAKTIFTGSTGYAALSDLAVGDYTVTEVLKDGWKNTTGLSLTKSLKEEKTETYIFGNKKVTKHTDPKPPKKVTPKPLPSTGPAETAGMAFGSLSLSGAAAAWIRSKKNLLKSFRK